MNEQQSIMNESILSIGNPRDIRLGIIEYIPDYTLQNVQAVILMATILATPVAFIMNSFGIVNDIGPYCIIELVLSVIMGACWLYLVCTWYMGPQEPERYGQAVLKGWFVSSLMAIFAFVIGIVFRILA